MSTATLSSPLWSLYITSHVAVSDNCGRQLRLLSATTHLVSPSESVHKLTSRQCPPSAPPPPKSETIPKANQLTNDHGRRVSLKYSGMYTWGRTYEQRISPLIAFLFYPPFKWEKNRHVWSAFTTIHSFFTVEESNWSIQEGTHGALMQTHFSDA